MNSFEFTKQYEALPSQAEYQAYVGVSRAGGDEEEDASYLPSNNVEYL